MSFSPVQSLFYTIRNRQSLAREGSSSSCGRLRPIPPCTSQASQDSLWIFLVDSCGHCFYKNMLKPVYQSLPANVRFCNCFAYSSASCLEIRIGRPGAEPLLLWVVRHTNNDNRDGSILKPLDNAMIWPLATSHTRLARLTARASFAQINARTFWQQSLALNDGSWPFAICTCSTVDSLVFVKGKSRRDTSHKILDAAQGSKRNLHGWKHAFIACSALIKENWFYLVFKAPKQKCFLIPHTFWTCVCRKLKKQQLLRLVPFATATSIAKALNLQGKPRDPERTCVNDMGSLEMFRGHKWIWSCWILHCRSKVRRFVMSQACRLWMVFRVRKLSEVVYRLHIPQHWRGIHHRWGSGCFGFKSKPGPCFNLRTVNQFAGLHDVQHWVSMGITICVLTLGVVQLPKNRWLLSLSLLQGTWVTGSDPPSWSSECECFLVLLNLWNPVTCSSTCWGPR